MSVAKLVRDARLRYGLSQRSLALRAGTTQAWVSAIERDRVHPSVEMLRRLMLVMGEELVLDSRPLPSDAQHDPIAFAHTRRQSMEERLQDALRWMSLTVE